MVTDIGIAEQHKAEEAMRETERRLRLIIETIPALVWSAKPNGDSFFASQLFLAYAGCSIEDLHPPNWLRFVHPDDVAETLSWLVTLRDGRRHETTHRLRRSDGIYRWFRAIAEPLRDENGEISEWFGLNIDIDDSRNMAETLRATQSRLSRATQIATVAELSASIAHEINQPLGAIVANATACEIWLTADTPNLERARIAIQRIVRDGNAAAEVIQRIRDLFRQSLPNKSALNMNEVIVEVLDLLSDESRKRHVVVKTDLAGDLPSTMADRIQMQQLISNLVHNAIESMDAVSESRKSLLVRSRLNCAGRVLVEIHDRGVGFDQADRIFDAFFTTKEKGMGMGLSIAKTIAEAHNGQLSARHNDNEGTVFSLILPLAGQS